MSQLLKIFQASLLLVCRAVNGTELPSTPSLTSQDGDQDNITGAIMERDPSSFSSYSTGNLVRGIDGNYRSWGVFPQATSYRRFEWNCTKIPIYTNGDHDDGDLGVFITNADPVNKQAFFMYHNLCDYIPFKYIWVNASATEFVSVPPKFEGRIVRGNEEWNLGGIPRPLGTWFEFALDNNSWIWGDVSLIRGCDGAVLMWALDASGAWKGFTQWILDGAPAEAYDKKPSGQWVVKATEMWNGSTDPVPRDWDMQMVGADYAYVDDAHGNPVITSTNGRFATYWSPGRI